MIEHSRVQQMSTPHENRTIAKTRATTRFRVTHELSDEELHQSITSHAAQPLTVSAFAPSHLCNELREALEPCGHHVVNAAADAHLRVIALPWHEEEIFEELRESAHEENRQPILPVRFDEFTVSIGPFLTASGPCPTCVLPAIINGSTMPLPDVESALFAGAASTCAMYIRTFEAATIKVALSLTIDSRTPIVEHRLWTCLPGCRRDCA